MFRNSRHFYKQSFESRVKYNKSGTFGNIHLYENQITLFLSCFRFLFVYLHTAKRNVINMN